MRDDVLFWEYDWNQVVENQKVIATKDAGRMIKSDFESSSIEDLAKQLCEKYSLEVPKLDKDAISIKQREVEIDVSGDRDHYFSSDGPHYVQGTAIDVRVPFHGDPGMFKVKPNSWTTVNPRGRVEANSIVFTISGTDLTQDNVRAEVDRKVGEIEQWLGFQENSIGNFSSELAQVVGHAIVARKKKLDADADLVSGLGYDVEQ